MTMESVQSSNISKIGYDEDEKVLRVEFKSGDTWEYHKVPESAYRGLSNAYSVGNYFAVNIKSKFPATRL